jgi:hypothetical protein
VLKNLIGNFQKGDERWGDNQNINSNLDFKSGYFRLPCLLTQSGRRLPSSSHLDVNIQQFSTVSEFRLTIFR